MRTNMADAMSMGCLLLLSVLKLTFFHSQILSLMTPGMAADRETRHLKSTQPHRVPCPDVEHVCTSLLKMDGVLSTEQGNYCACPGCEDPTWDEEDKKSLTWYHFERSDWLVQYRFCDSLMAKQECNNPEEIAAVIRTDAKGWNPRIKKRNCYCPKNRYFLHGWTLVYGQSWDYHYTCDRPACEENPCVKHYIDKETMKTMGYKFLCSCAEGYICPTSKHNKKNKEKIKNSDNKGSFIYGYCDRHSSTPKGSGD